MEVVARQLIRAIRGHRSQEAFSRRLGYSSNPVADWEAGRRYPTAAETLRACRLAQIDVAAAFQRFSAQEAGLLGEGDEHVVALVDETELPLAVHATLEAIPRLELAFPVERRDGEVDAEGQVGRREQALERAHSAGPARR